MTGAVEHANQVRCPGGHVLCFVEAVDPVYPDKGRVRVMCDHCGETIRCGGRVLGRIDEPAWHCADCMYDLCTRCHELPPGEFNATQVPEVSLYPGEVLVKPGDN